MNINISFHNGNDLRWIKKGFKEIMGALDDMRVVLGEINAATDDIAADIDDLMARLAGGLTGDEAAALSGDLGAIRDRLQGVAGEWPVVAPGPEPVPPEG